MFQIILIYYFKPKDFKYDFYYWIGKIILSKSFGIYPDYIKSRKHLGKIDLYIIKTIVLRKIWSDLSGFFVISLQNYPRQTFFEQLNYLT